MKILIKQFLNQKHSWSYIGHELARNFKKNGHSVDLFPTDYISEKENVLPKDLKNNIIGFRKLNESKIFGKDPGNNYDMVYSYTSFKNVEYYLQHSKSKRYIQWCYEWVSTQNKNILPQKFNLVYKYCDYVLAPTNYVKDLQFIPAKIPTDKIKVIPHGINPEIFKSENKINLTQKKFKFLINLQQTHLRKNLNGLLEAYGNAFSNKDDVCLVIKAKNKPVENPFDFSLSNYLKSFYDKYPNHAEVKVFSDFIENISDLYNSIDCVISLSHGEGFNMPLLESLAAGKPVIATSIGPHLDFTNSNNTLYVESKFDKADLKSMYWEKNANAEWIVPNLNDAADKMIYMYKNHNTFNVDKNYIYNNFSWKKISNDIINL